MATKVLVNESEVNHVTSNDGAVSDACLALLEKKTITNQRQLKNLLLKQGFEHINQSFISKLLASLGVIKVANASGKKVYTLANTLHCYSVNQPLKEQIQSIRHNHLHVVVKTEEGFAQAVEQFFTHNCQDFILGCISGFDSLLVIPAKNISASQCEQQIRRYLAIIS